MEIMKQYDGDNEKFIISIRFKGKLSRLYRTIYVTDAYFIDPVMCEIQL